MQKKKIEVYDDGYSHSREFIRLTAALSALLLCGGLSACGRDKPEEFALMGEELYIPTVSESDVSPSDACSSDDEMFTLDGDIAYLPDGSN